MGRDDDIEEAAAAATTTPKRLTCPDQVWSWQHRDGQRRGSGQPVAMPREEAASHDNLSLPWKARLKHFTWTWFTLTMATGGLAAVLWHVPENFRFNGIYGLGVFFMFLNIAIFIFNSVCISLRFYWWPYTLRASFLHPTESLFTPAPVISLCVILTNITQYGLTEGKAGAWLTVTLAVFYWLYVSLAIGCSAGIYLLMWTTQMFTLSEMTPIWIFPAYPLLVAGPFASALSHPDTGRGGASAARIIVSGIIIQGIGFMVSFMVYSAYLYRLMTQKLPPESLRPGMFISVGPSAFTIIAVVDLGSNFAKQIPKWNPDFMGDARLAAVVTNILGNWVGIWLWGLALWFFLVTIGAHYSCVSHGRMTFAMTWNSFIFPNTALAMATFVIAKALDDNQPIAILGCIMAIALVLGWLFTTGMAIRAVVLKQILWPQKQEDKDIDKNEQDVRYHHATASNPPPVMTPIAENRPLDFSTLNGNPGAVNHKLHRSES